MPIKLIEKKSLELLRVNYILNSCYNTTHYTKYVVERGAATVKQMHTFACTSVDSKYCYLSIFLPPIQLFSVLGRRNRCIYRLRLGLFKNLQ